MLNPSQLGVALHIKTSHFICRAKHLTSFYMKYIAGLKWSKIQLKFDLTFGKTYCSARNVNCNNKTFTDVYLSLRKKASVFGVILARISPAFGLNTEIQSISPYSVHAGKMRTRITPKMDTFYAVICKKMPLFKTILRILEELQHKFKKSSLVSANRPGENFFICHPAA